MALAHIHTSEEFLPTIRYASRTRPKADKGSPLPPVVFSTFPAYSPGLISELMEERARLSKRVRKPCYHISLTLPQQDAGQFERSDWSDLTKDFIERMELSDRQAVAYLHEDAVYPDGEERPHVHLVVNRVGEDGRCVDTSWDFYRAQSALREAEKHLGLTRERSSWEVERRRDSPGQVQRCRREAGEQLTVHTQLQNSVDEALERANTLGGVANFLRGLGADVRISERGWSLKRDGVAFQGSQLGRAYGAEAIVERAAVVRGRSLDEYAEPTSDVDRANGMAVVHSLRLLAGHEFRKPKGGVRMPSGEGFDYLVRIDRREDGAHQITGTRSDSGDTVLRAGLRGGEATIEQSNIPAGFVDALAAQAERARRRRRARTRDREREQDDELSL